MSEENKNSEFSFENESYRKTYWHTCSHILAQAVKRLYPEVKLAIGPSIDEGWYYDLDAPFAFTPEHLEKIEDIKGVQKEIGWGNQIRSYVLQPYTLVKDHRTDVETGNVDAVLDGGLDIFINGYLKWISVQGDKKNTEN